MTTKSNGVKRFGKLESIQIKNGKSGPFAVITVDCKRFKQVAFAFGKTMIDQVKAAGEGASVWLIGKFEEVQKTNAEGKSYTDHQMRVVVFRVGEAKAAVAAADAASSAPAVVDEVPETPDALIAIKGIGATIAAKLNAAGVETFTALSAMTDEALDAIAKGTAKRATNGDWRGIAALLSAEKAAAAVSPAELMDEAPF